MHVYDDEFFETADRTAALSAERMLHHLATVLPIRSVLDLGCGRGVWLARWLALGIHDVVGADGPYINPANLHIPEASFIACDLAQPLALNRQFDLVQSLEVAEHLPPASADIFIENIISHGKLVLFSAAVIGQGGENHLNEQSWEYWRAKFYAHGFEVFDFIRPLVRNDPSIFFWYRHNTFLYAHASVSNVLPKVITQTRVPPGAVLQSHVPLPYKLQTSVVRYLPRVVVNFLSRSKYKIINKIHSRQN